jgi:hypothetical protein
MELLSTIAIFLLTLVGYSLGAVLCAGRERSTTPGILDLFVLILLWIGAYLLRTMLGQWFTILVGFTIALILAYLRTLPTLGRQTSTSPDVDQPREASFLRRFWEGWKALAAAMGNYQGRLVLSFFYFVIVSPWGLLTRLFSDPLQLKRVQGISLWNSRDSVTGDLEEAKRQF